MDWYYLGIVLLVLAGCLWLTAFLVGKSIEEAADLGADE